MRALRILVESLADPASKTIARELRSLAGLAPGDAAFEGRPVETSPRLPDAALVTLPGLHLEASGLDGRLAAAGLAPSAVIFLSKHRSTSGEPALTVHPLGNFAEASLGGEPGAFTTAAPALMTETLRAIERRRAEAAYPAQTTFEVTHHGPLLSAPAFFVELGSGPEAWTDAHGGRILAHALMDVLSRPVPEHPIAIGLGGGHYAPRFTDTALSRAMHYGHFWPRHHLGATTDVTTLLDRLVRATPGVSAVHLHDGTLPAPLLGPFEKALGDLGLAVADARAWPLRAQERETSRRPPISF